MLQRLIVFATLLVPAMSHADDSRWLTLGAMSEAKQYDAARGVRGELDLVTWQGWSFGAVASVANATIGVYSNMSVMVHTVDVKGMGYVARTAKFEQWELRGALGLGIIHTSGEADDAYENPVSESHRTFPTAEASLHVTVPISPSWAITGGPIASYYDQWFRANGGETHRLAELVVLAGVSYRM
jgi:hypothetical protein